MAEEHPTQVIGIFESQEQAAAAMAALLQAKFSPGQMILVARDWGGEALPGPYVDLQHVAARGAARGAFIGALIGAMIGILVSLLPDVSFGALGLGVLGAAGGAALGSYFGPFIALGWNETEAREHAHHVELGRTVIVVRSVDRQAEARTIMVAHGAYDRSMATSP